MVSDLDEVLLEKRVEILNNQVTPLCQSMGLSIWNGKYKWFSKFNDFGIKHVLEYVPLKGYGGCFAYGNCFDFVPTLSGKRLNHHRTDKSTEIIYYKKFFDWRNSIRDNTIWHAGRVSTINENEFRKTLAKSLKRNLPETREWFNQNSSIESNIVSLLDDVGNSINP